MSVESRRRYAPPPALSISQATPLSSQTSLVIQDEADDVMASPSAGRNLPKRKMRNSKEFQADMEQEFEDGVMRGEFALLQEVAIREKRLKLALFGRGKAASLTRPAALRPHSMAAISKKLPDSPTRRDGASSPEIEEMIKKGRRSLSASARKMRRRRSTGALRNPDNWRRSDIDRALATIPNLPHTPLTGGSGRFEGRRGMDLDRDSLDLTGMVDSPDMEQEDPNLDSDSSLDLHTPLVSTEILRIPSSY
jgi:hypothetical protein